MRLFEHFSTPCEATQRKRVTIKDQEISLVSKTRIDADRHADNRGSSTVWMALVLLGMLGLLSYQVAQGLLVPLDRVVAEWAASWHVPSLDPLVRTITFFGSSAWTIVALGLLGGWAWQRHGRTASIRYVGAFGLGLAIEMALRLLVAQWRPDTLSVPASMDWQTRFELAGYPSGHAYRSAVTFGWLISETSRSRWVTVTRWTSVVMIVLVGLSRLYLNRHWATDVIGSWLVAAVVLLIARQVSPQSTVHSP